MIKALLLATGLLLGASLNALAAEDSDLLRQIQQQWAEANYQSEGDSQEAAFEALVTRIDQATETNPDDAALWIWSGIVKSSFAGAKGGLGALSLAKAARRDLERALELDPAALDGSAYTSLGALYYQVPGWPVGFGNDRKASEMLNQALAANPEGIDSNYFYGDFLLDQGDLEQAEHYLQKALEAPPRPDRPLADQGRQQEIRLALQSVHDKMAH